MTAPVPPSRFSAISTHGSILAEPRRLIERYGRAVRGYLAALLGEADAEDAAQEFALRLCNGLVRQWDPTLGRFRAWLRTTVHHFAEDFRRDRARRRRWFGPLPADVPALAAPPEEVWLRLLRDELLSAALRAFRDGPPPAGPLPCATAELLRDEPDLTGQSLADRLRDRTGRACTADNARKLRSRVLRRLAELLRGEVAQTLDSPSPEAVEEELRLLGLRPIADEPEE